MQYWQSTRYRIDLTRPQVMAIVNVTPDSFSDGGRHASCRAAIEHCERLVTQGADILDIGGESSRPGAEPLPLDEELARVMPVLHAALGLGVPISIDTYKPEVMRAVLDAGADIVNDIHALTRPGAIESILPYPLAGVCLMHMQGAPTVMQQRPAYGDVVDEVGRFLRERRDLLLSRGVAADRITLDPGIGFGKTVAHNLELLVRQRELMAIGQPLLVGWSRKSTLGTVTGRPVDQRMAASLAAALAAVEKGARIVRGHDVAETVDALKIWQAAGQL